MKEEDKRRSSRNIAVMVILILAMITGIIARRGFIRSEIETTLRKMFPPRTAQER